MIGQSTTEYYFVRGSIVFFNHITPIGALLCIIALIWRPQSYAIPVPFKVWAVAEAAFLFLIFIPHRVRLQRAATHPDVLPKDKRKELFQLCISSIDEPESYFRGWFRGADLRDIQRENVKQLYCWAFLNKSSWDPADEPELEDYTDKVEALLGSKLEPGWGNAVPLRVTIDEVKTQYRPLLWYMCVSVVDTITCCLMQWHSYSFYRLPLKRIFTVFPLRPWALLSRHRSSAKNLTYWHRPHLSKTRLPVLFIHGIGIGLYPYVNFLAEVNRTGELATDDDIGIIALEIMPVSFRLTGSALPPDQMCSQILQILREHGWQKVVLVSHSYGSIISTHLLHDSEAAGYFGPVLLIDPVTILLHLPDVAYNFTCRPPKSGPEYQLWYFASMDQSVARTLGRHFFWSLNVLWKHDLMDRAVTVSLAGKDLIVNTEAVGRYLTNDGLSSAENGDYKVRQWRGQGLDILWFKELDHAQVFDSTRNRRILANVVRVYSTRD